MRTIIYIFICLCEKKPSMLWAARRFVQKKTNGSMHTVLRGPSVPYIVVGTYKDVSIHGCAPHKDVALYKEVSVYGRVLYKEWLYTTRLTYNDVNIHIANIGTYTSTEHRSHCP